MDQYKPIAKSIVLGTAFERSLDGSYHDGFEYSRDDNPNRRDLERSLSALEGGFDTAAFAAGGALMSVLVKGGADDAIRVSNRMKVFKRATSFRAPSASWSIENRSKVRPRKRRRTCYESTLVSSASMN